MESTKNATTLRLLHYPSIKKDSVIKPGQIRCGEHTDYGSITLLFQDEMPGLEVFPLHFEQSEKRQRGAIKFSYSQSQRLESQFFRNSLTYTGKN